MGRLITGSDALTAAEVQALIDAQIAEGASDWPAITNKPTTLDGAGITDLAHAWVTPPGGEWVVTTIGGADTLVGSARNVLGLELFQFVPQAAVTLTQVAVSVSAALSGALGRVLIYDTDVDGRPAGKLYQSIDLDCSAVGFKTDTCALSLARGKRYWIGSWFNLAVTMHVWPVSALPDINGGVLPSTSGRKILRRTVGYGNAAPDPFGWSPSEINGGRPAAVWLGVA